MEALQSVTWGMMYWPDDREHGGAWLFSAFGSHVSKGRGVIFKLGRVDSTSLRRN